MTDKVTKDNVERWANMIERDLKELKEFCDAFAYNHSCQNCPFVNMSGSFDCPFDYLYEDYKENGKWDLMALIADEEEEEEEE